MIGSALYVDASVIGGLVLGDIAIGPVVAAIGTDVSLVYSRFGFGKVVAAIGAQVRATHGSDADAAAQIVLLRAILKAWRHEHFAAGDIDRAIALVGRASLALKLPDAIHVATAERLGLPLLTGDPQQARAAERLGLPTSFLSMKDIR